MHIAPLHTHSMTLPLSTWCSPFLLSRLGLHLSNTSALCCGRGTWTRHWCSSADEDACSPHINREKRGGMVVALRVYWMGKYSSYGVCYSTHTDPPVATYTNIIIFTVTRSVHSVMPVVGGPTHYTPSAGQGVACYPYIPRGALSCYHCNYICANKCFRLGEIWLPWKWAIHSLMLFSFYNHSQNIWTWQPQLQ